MVGGKTHWKIAVLFIVSMFVVFSGRGYAGTTHPTVSADTQIYIVGGGLAGLTAAATAIQDANIPGKNIHILEKRKVAGGACDSTGGTRNKPYFARGARLYDPTAFRAFRKFLAKIPSYDDQKEMEKLGNNSGYKAKKTLDDEFAEFSATHKIDSITRLVGKDQQRINHLDYGLSMRDRYDLFKLVRSSEESTYGKRIDEYFQPAFFQTSLWYQWSSIFGFMPYHGLTEMQRYSRTFFHILPNLKTLHDTAWVTPYNTYQSVIEPTVMWLKTQGVNFHMGCKVTDVDFKPSLDEKTIQRIYYTDNGTPKTIEVRNNDFVLITNGSKVADTPDSGVGDMKNPPKLERGKVDGSWTLWEKMATKQPGLGNPNAFTTSIDHSKIQLVSITTSTALFGDMVLKFSKNKVMGEQHEMIFVDSPWQIVFHQTWHPFVKNQDPNTTIFMLMALKHAPGDYVKKKMEDCTGEEILQELCYQLGFMKEMPEILRTSVVMSQNEPYVSSQFLLRNKYDRPPVVPDRSTNLAFIGEFAEMPDESVFLMNYSCKTAEVAIYTLLNINKEPTPFYHGVRSPWNWIRAVISVM